MKNTLFSVTATCFCSSSYKTAALISQRNYTVNYNYKYEHSKLTDSSSIICYIYLYLVHKEKTIGYVYMTKTIHITVVFLKGLDHWSDNETIG